VNTIGIVAVDGLGRQDRAAASRRGERGHPATDQISGERRQLCVLVFREAVFDRQVVTFNVTALTQAAITSLADVCFGQKRT
jgi:hypothetical protein